MLKKIIVFLFIFILTNTVYSKATDENGIGREISNEYFSFIMPYVTDGTYYTEKKNNGIFICEKTPSKSKDKVFAFGFQIFKNPSEYSHLKDYKKIGELTDKNGVLYDMILKKPTEEIYTDGRTTQNFLKLYESAENIEIKGINGNIYHKNQGTKGEDLYSEVLKKYKQAIKEHWNYSKLKQENFTTISKLVVDKKVSLKKTGYVFYDINSDGIDELFIGKISKYNGTIYDLYTIVNRKPKHVMSINYPEDELFICNDNFLCKESHIAKDKNIFTVRTLKRNINSLNSQIEYLYNSRLDKENPWFLRFNDNEKYERITEKEYEQGIKVFNNYKKINYTPLNKFD